MKISIYNKVIDRIINFRKRKTKIQLQTNDLQTYLQRQSLAQPRRSSSPQLGNERGISTISHSIRRKWKMFSVPSVRPGDRTDGSTARSTLKYCIVFIYETEKLKCMENFNKKT